jgi:hypothetical protein
MIRCYCYSAAQLYNSGSALNLDAISLLTANEAALARNREGPIALGDRLTISLRALA